MKRSVAVPGSLSTSSLSLLFRCLLACMSLLDELAALQHDDDDREEEHTLHDQEHDDDDDDDDDDALAELIDDAPSQQHHEEVIWAASPLARVLSEQQQQQQTTASIDAFSFEQFDDRQVAAALATAVSTCQPAPLDTDSKLDENAAPLVPPKQAPRSHLLDGLFARLQAVALALFGASDSHLSQGFVSAADVAAVALECNRVVLQSHVVLCADSIITASTVVVDEQQREQAVASPALSVDRSIESETVHTSTMTRNIGAIRSMATAATADALLLLFLLGFSSVAVLLLEPGSHLTAWITALGAIGLLGLAAVVVSARAGVERLRKSQYELLATLPTRWRHCVALAQQYHSLVRSSISAIQEVELVARGYRVYVRSPPCS